MTFYWWSHWFWITLLSNILFPIINVHTYPSHEISLDYNQNDRTVKTVTKLYQTTTTLTWATSAPPNYIKMGVTAEKTILQNVTPEIEKETEDEDEELLDETESDEHQQQDEHVELEEEVLDAETEDVNEEDNISEEFEYKRSAENYNKTNEELGSEKPKPESLSTSDNNQGSMIAAEAANDDSADIIAAAAAAAPSGSVKLRREEVDVSNYTNFSNAISTNSSSDSITNSNISLTNLEVQEAKAVTTLSATPSTPKIDTFAAQSTLEWFNAMTQAQLPPPSSHVASDEGDEHKVPFTLENVNKEDELRRAENEHRSRKSKVLSAEYKHINRYINFSTDSKNLLTRSASSAPDEFGTDESNISSEALQRTYFLDAGTISAICFTVFGICCTVGTIGIVLYRRRFLNKPQALSEPDSSVYIDDSTVRVSDNSDEMYSLDNDSFLNSLEAMTIQNYWTDTVKHTKL